MTLTKKLLKEQKRKLEKEKKQIKEGLKSFAKKDTHVKGNWRTKFPNFGFRTADPSEEADQVEEYEAALPMEHALETKLKKVEQALKRIKNKSYGTCEKCKKGIKIERLKAYPETNLCIKCAEGGKQK